MSIKEQLVQMVSLAAVAHEERFNPETYKDTIVQGETGMLKYSIVLGNLYAKGYLNDEKVNFEIFKDHSGWQIWVWEFESLRPENNQFNAPYYKYTDVIDYLNSL